MNLMWFRRDLRTLDNSALNQALANGATFAVFIATPQSWLNHEMSAAQADLTLRALSPLQQSLQQLGVSLKVLFAKDYAESIKHIEHLCQTYAIQTVYFNREYEENEIQRDKQLCQRLSAHNILCQSFDDQCILPPKSVCKQNGDYYQVFTPFYRRWRALLLNLPSCQYPSKQQNPFPAFSSSPNSIDEIYQQAMSYFTDPHGALQHCQQAYLADEHTALSKLHTFIEEKLAHYPEERNIPSIEGTSGLSPYLAIGLISARTICQQVMMASDSEASNTFISELAWRDFYKHILFYRADLIRHHAFLTLDQYLPWRYDDKDFKRWCNGQTGVPIVDAAMRCLNATGFMHNRLRMIVAMFLTKDLFIDWRLGERYFMQNLIDGDFSANNGGWQWSASVGNDAVPYFRIMNPYTQGKRFDPHAHFIKTWLPEVRSIHANILHDENKLQNHLSTHPNAYPKAIVNHKQARQQTLELFKQAKAST